MLEKCTITGFADEINCNLVKQINGLKKLGLQWMEIRGVNGKSLVEYTLEEVREFKRMLDEKGISVSAIGSPIGKQDIREDFEPHLVKFHHTVEIAKIMKTPYIRVFSFFIPDGQDAECYRMEIMNRLDQLVQYAKLHDIILLHENEKGIYGDTASRCKDILQMFYGPNFKAIFDFANFVQCGQETLEAYRVLEEYIAYFHIKDARKLDGDVVPCGMGDGNIRIILSDLSDKGYKGFLSLEPHLSHFQGFTDLEKEDSKKGKEQDMTGEVAFTVALASLKTILGWT